MKTVFVGLSGGVDSSVAAALLQREGYNVVGIYMKNWTADLPGVHCPWREDLADARAVAARLDIPLRIYDFQTEYRQRVVAYMVEEYQAGRTPNPDIMCNQEIKFQLFLGAALADSADLIATGHYARVQDGQLLRAQDDSKDQTYFLYRVTQEALQKTLMPIGGYTKPEVRALAKKLNLPTATKKDSQGLCFVGPVGMKAFLRQYVEAEPGPIMLADGRAIGTHDGAIFYTIGQRSGLGVGGGKPFYVLRKDMGVNTVVVTDDPEDLALHSDRIQLEDLHWIGAPPQAGKTCQVRFRHRGELVEGTLGGVSKLISTLALKKPVKAVAPGQSAVVYDGEVCLGGGVIASVIPVATASH
jgi:tRNA-specific 2-thiouridylase